MKKVNNRFSLDALTSKVELNKVEMQTIKGGFICYCNGVATPGFDNVNSCVNYGCTVSM
jgi:natural product precursor